MRHEDFEELVRQAFDALPGEFLRRLDNVDVLVRDWPTEEQLEANHVGPDERLFGLYEGVPLTDRDGYNMVLPDTITIFQGPIEQACGSPREMVDEVHHTVVHEFAHHFGISDEDLEGWGVA
jgi:predicted Zn-dependent protease with MMP-like domain